MALRAALTSTEMRLQARSHSSRNTSPRWSPAAWRSSPAMRFTPARRPRKWQLRPKLWARRYMDLHWPSHIPFPTSHPLWAGNFPTVARGMAEILSRYDAIFALGGKSLITILYTEGSAVPPGCDVFQLSADVRDLGRTYVTKLSVVGEIKASLKALLPHLFEATKSNRGAYATLLQKAQEERAAQRRSLSEMADAEMNRTLTTPLVAAREAVRAIGPDVAIVDEAVATSGHVRKFLNSQSPNQYSFIRGGGLGWGMPAAVGCSLGLGRAPVVCLVGDGAAMYSPQALWTAAHEKLPVTFVVMNNREYNVLKNFMRTQADYVAAKTNRFIAMDIQQPEIDYLSLARAMGCPRDGWNEQPISRRQSRTESRAATRIWLRFRSASADPRASTSPTEANTWRTGYGRRTTRSRCCAARRLGWHVCVNAKTGIANLSNTKSRRLGWA